MAPLFYPVRFDLSGRLSQSEYSFVELGCWKLQTINGGRFRLDGGAMFGVVPKPLWEKLQPADERNRIRMAANCLLATCGPHRVLIDTGYGGKLSPRERDINAAEEGEPLLTSLRAAGIEAQEITAVVLTHLHFDHSGGATRFEELDRVVPTFPRATYYVQRTEWQVANSGAPEFAAGYDTQNFLALEEAQQLQLLDGACELLPGLSVLPTPYHTPGHQSVLFSSAGQRAIYLADLCPMRAHLRRLWCMAYDLFPLETRRHKPEVLGRAADERWLVMWCHDPDVAAGYLARDPKQEFVVTESFATL